MQTTAFILGGAQCLYLDFYKAFAMLGRDPDTLIACNYTGRDFPGELDHWVTSHTEPGWMPRWIRERELAGLPPAAQYWTGNTHATIPPEDRKLYHRVPNWDGSSGLVAVQAALMMGYKKIILCGVPLTKDGGHTHHSGEWKYADSYHKFWRRHKTDMLGRVKSFSGYTKDLLGEPTQEWLKS